LAFQACSNREAFIAARATLLPDCLRLSALDERPAETLVNEPFSVVHLRLGTAFSYLDNAGT